MRGKSLFITRLSCMTLSRPAGSKHQKDVRRSVMEMLIGLIRGRAEMRKVFKKWMCSGLMFLFIRRENTSQQPTYDGWSCECRLVCRLEIWQLIEQKCAQILCLSSDTAGSFWCSCNLWEIIKSIYTTFYKLNNVCASRSWSFRSSKHWIQH